MSDIKISEIRTTGLGIANGKHEYARREWCRIKINAITQKLLTAEYGSEEYRKLQLELLEVIM